jgi:hypothetical protein
MHDAVVEAGRRVFVYPAREQRRRHGPRGYLNYRAYKPWLRDEFAFRCVDCLCRERWCPNGHEEFAADHLVSRAASPNDLADYENLLYACQSCNRNRQDIELPLNPGRNALGVHLRVGTDGSVRALTAEGRFIVRACHLNRPLLLLFRKRMLALIDAWIERSRAGDEAALRDLLAFPSNLPDLATLRPPRGNTRPEGIAESYEEQRKRGELPSVY